MGLHPGDGFEVITRASGEVLLVGGPGLMSSRAPGLEAARPAR